MFYLLGQIYNKNVVIARKCVFFSLKSEQKCIFSHWLSEQKCNFSHFQYFKDRLLSLCDVGGSRLFFFYTLLSPPALAHSTAAWQPSLRQNRLYLRSALLSPSDYHRRHCRKQQQYKGLTNRRTSLLTRVTTSGKILSPTYSFRPAIAIATLAWRSVIKRLIHSALVCLVLGGECLCITHHTIVALHRTTISSPLL